jgi:hypothetical protein
MSWNPATLAGAELSAERLMAIEFILSLFC